VQRDVRLAAKVGDVDAGPSAGDKHAVGLGPHPFEKGQIFIQAEVLVIILADVVGRRGHHQMYRVVGQLGHLLRRDVEDRVQGFGRNR
jgi:hypothetical protein